MAKELNKNELTKEQMEKAMGCKTVEELMAVAKAEGYELTKDEAEAYMAELADVELGDEVLEKAAGGLLIKGCPQLCMGFCGEYVGELGERVLQNCPTYAPGSPKF